MMSSYRDESSISDQKYENHTSWDLYYEDFIFKNDFKKFIFKEVQHIKTRF